MGFSASGTAWRRIDVDPGGCANGADTETVQYLDFLTPLPWLTVEKIRSMKALYY